MRPFEFNNDNLGIMKNDELSHTPRPEGGGGDRLAAFVEEFNQLRNVSIVNQNWLMKYNASVEMLNKNKALLQNFFRGEAHNESGLMRFLVLLNQLITKGHFSREEARTFLEKQLDIKKLPSDTNRNIDALEDRIKNRILDFLNSVLK